MRAISGIVLVFCVASAAYAQQADNGAGQLKIQLMKTTEVVAVTGYLGTPDKFAEDTDPNTLQIVFLAKPELGPSRVSGDGEVIFLTPDIAEQEQSSLIGKAFDIRVQRRLAAQKSN